MCLLQNLISWKICTLFRNFCSEKISALTLTVRDSITKTNKFTKSFLVTVSVTMFKNFNSWKICTPFWNFVLQKIWHEQNRDSIPYNKNKYLYQGNRHQVRSPAYGWRQKNKILKNLYSFWKFLFRKIFTPYVSEKISKYFFQERVQKFQEKKKEC